MGPSQRVYRLCQQGAWREALCIGSRHFIGAWEAGYGDGLAAFSRPGSRFLRPPT